MISNKKEVLSFRTLIQKIQGRLFFRLHDISEDGKWEFKP